MKATLLGVLAHIKNKFLSVVHSKGIVAITLIALLVGGGIYLFQSQQVGDEANGEIYTLVPEKISSSANIEVRLPEDLAIVGFDPAKNISFTPEIKGAWQASDAAQKIYRYLPDQALPVGAHYLATLDTSELRLEKMFSIDKDPSVLAVFPKGETEVSEYSRITIMFSRPMVALGTLSDMADMAVPVTLTPHTEGRWKWVTTRTLEFIPKTRLVRSANYHVEVNDGFKSEDGVSVAPFMHDFHTRVLNYQGGAPYSQVSLAHDQPMQVTFNQPVDIEQMKSRISVSASGTISLPVTLAYGSREEYDPENGRTKKLLDKSVIEIYPDHDSLGRAFLWDFDTNLNLHIAGAIGTEGDIALTEERNINYRVSPIITSVAARSDRSQSVTPEFFDPTGKLEVTVGEPINLSASSISGKGVSNIIYGQTCKAPNAGEETPVSSIDCPKVDDHQTLLISFDPKQFDLGETSSISLKKLVNDNGVLLNNSTLTVPFTTYRKFEILSTSPSENQTGAILDDLMICSSGPIRMPDDEEFYTKFHSNMMVGKWNWGGSYLVSSAINQAEKHCQVGTFETHIRYGLVPLYKYHFDLSLDDHFGQHASRSLNFTSGDADPLAKNIEPLQNTVLMATPDKTKLGYGLDFMSSVDVSVCKLSALSMLRLRVDPLVATEGPGNVSCTSIIRKHIDLPDSYATRKYVQINIADYFPDTIGNYVVFVTNPGFRQARYDWNGDKRTFTLGDQIYDKTYITITNLAIGAKQAERNDYSYGYSRENDSATLAKFMEHKWPSNLLWVNDAHTQNGTEGAVVTQYAMVGENLTPLPSVKTDSEGIATLPSADNVVGTLIDTGSEHAVLSLRTDSLSYASGASAARREYVYTDRPIYRPGDTVHIKGISRIGYDARFENPNGSTIIELRDASYASVRKETVTFSKNGTYETEFVLGDKVPLGNYQISSNTGGYASFSVEEYVAPDFKVSVSADKEEYISGDTANLVVDAQYYFGVPVQNGDVEYKIISQDYYFDRYHDEYFNFGGGWYGNDNGWYGDRYLTSGKTKLDSSGKVTIATSLDIDKLFNEDYRSGSKLITMRATVKGPDGRSVTSEHSLILHRATFYAGLSSDRYFYHTGESGTIKIKSVDTKGTPVSKNNLTIELSKVEWKSYKRQEVDGNFYYRSEQILTKISEDKIDTDNSGNGTFSFTAPDEGEYQVSLHAKDERGNPVNTTYGIYVSGVGNAEIRPTNNATLELVTQNTNLSVGGIGRFVIKSPYQKAKALVTIARGDIYERKVLDISSSLTEYTFNVPERYIPNVSAQVLLLSPLPEVKYGEVNYSVGTKEKELSIVVSANKPSFLPGEDVALDVSVKDANGNPVEGEVSLAVIDESVLALVGNPKKNPVAFFYSGEPVVIRTLSNIKNVLTIAEIPTGTKGGSGGGGNDLEKKKRGEFRDTAFWQGIVHTDRRGHASIRFTLPDNLTSWQVESVGVADETKVGVGYANFVSRKPLMATPLKPRFVLPGDAFSIGGTIFNESDQRAKIEVNVESPSLTFTGKRTQSINLEPHSSLSLTFPVIAPTNLSDGTHSFTLSAKSDAHEDTVTSSFPIERDQTYESTVTSGRVTDATWKERLFLPGNVVPDRGSLTLTTSATMASLMTDAIKSMLVYPYECSEQIASKLRTIALVKQNAALFGTSTPLITKYLEGDESKVSVEEVVKTGLAKIYQSESADGGVAFYPGNPANFWLTRAVLETYIDLRDAGFPVDQGKIDAAGKFVFNYVMYPPNPYVSADDTIASAYILDKLGDAKLSSPQLDKKIAEYANNKDLIEHQLSTPALAYLSVLASKHKLGFLTTNRLFSEFENRSNIDARGTIVKSRTGNGYNYFEDELANTALALKAFSESKRDTPLLEGYLRAIKQSRVKDGGWSSTYSSITVIDALTKYLAWKKEASAHLHVGTTLDGTSMLNAEWNKSNVTDQFATTVPMTGLKIGKSQTIVFNKKDLGSQKDAYYYDLSLRYYLPADKIPARDEGFAVTRAFYRIDDTKLEHPVKDAVQGEVLREHITIKTGVTRAKVGVEDFIPAGVEIVNQRFATEDSSLGQENNQYSGYLGLAPRNKSSMSSILASIFSSNRNAGPKNDTDGEVEDESYGGRVDYESRLYPTATENHDDRMFAFLSELLPGEYVYDYYVRALVPGTYQHLPLVVSELYTPENFGRTEGSSFIVKLRDE